MKKFALLLAGGLLIAGVAFAQTQSGTTVETEVLNASERVDGTQLQTGQAVDATVVIPDMPIRDGAIPPQAPAGFETGWDIEDVSVTYDSANDELLVVLSSHGIIGDPEGNGDPSSWAPEWDAAGLPGTDEPDLGGLEHAVVTFDLNQDGSGDVIAGVPQSQDISSFSISSMTPGFDPVPFIAFAFGAPLSGEVPTAAPDADNPDIEFTIANFSTIVAGDTSLDFGINAFLGSGSDGNIGEDTLAAPGTFEAVVLGAELGDQVFLDENSDGINDPSEPGIPDVTVNLLDEGGNVIDTMVTDQDGNFLFMTGPGTFNLEFIAPPGLSFTEQFQGTDDSADSNADPMTGLANPVTVAPGESLLTIDAGLVEFVPAPSIDIEKATNGQDADDAPGIELVVGETATFTFVVTNTGNVDLADVAVTDNVLGDICTIGNLAVGASDTCETTAVVTEGQTTNVATTTGQPLDPTTGLPVGDPVTDDDPSNHTGVVPFVPAPSIDIEKATNGQDADDAPGIELVVGETATFTFVVTNTGNVDLADVAVTDNVLGDICTIGNLAVGASDTCETTAVVTEGQTTNVATTTGQPLDPTTGLPVGDPVTDDDPSNHTGVVEGPPCVANERGPRLWAGHRVVWDTGYDAQAGSTLVVTTEEPGGSPGQPNEQVYVFVGDVMYGPTPIDLGTIEIDVTNTGRLSFVHYSVITGDDSMPNSVEIEFCGTGLSPTQTPACQTNISGPRLHAGGQVQWNSGLIAEAGSVVRITTTEPGESPDQPNEQVWVKVGPELFGPTPVGLGTIEFTAELGGEVLVLHFSRITGLDDRPNSVEFELCGTHLN